MVQFQIYLVMSDVDVDHSLLFAIRATATFEIMH